MQPARMMLCVAAVVVVTLTPQTQATFSLAALPAVASVGGLAALKVLKFVGLSKLSDTFSHGGFDVLAGDLDDSGSEYFDDQRPIYVAPPPSYVAPPPTYYSAPLPLAGPPAFYIVPASSFNDFRRIRRDVSKVTAGSRPAGVVAVRSEKEYFEVIGGLDENGCVLRAVCEVAGARQDTLSEDERAIMAAFSGPYKPSSNPPTSPRAKYYQAVWVGRTAGDATTICAKMYSSCPVPARQLLKALEEEEQQQQQKDETVPSP